MSAPHAGHLRLGVNIDHIATLRHARYSGSLDAANCEPSLLAAAHEAEAAGADSITIHLRQDRRHIQDRDVYEMREKIHTELNLEIGNTTEILAIALQVRPHYVCLVPENRQEITTEGGLDLRRADATLGDTIGALQASGIRVSLLLDPDLRQIERAAELRADMVELHTGAFANAAVAGGDRERKALVEASQLAHRLGLQVNAGNGITLMNLPNLLQVPHLAELNVGHHLISRAVFLGLGRVVREMVTMLRGYTPERNQAQVSQQDT